MLNGLFLWDFHCILRLEKWKSEYKEQFPAWLKILGNVDAYSSLGNYAFNNPDFVYPVLVGQQHYILLQKIWVIR